ncbi:hypothetical protein PENTCL1PPCAC_18367 [Pristionchus entomophagus]|uniref:Uncharacterized protein n=1 Tax=Pristionchus entomophagus TaxID=358040 RepID=A0AAV5TP90_9BILA|nr:hypothetical protein PENTCL1PPCAC_18367 [Pristionchus entomophagus]
MAARSVLEAISDSLMAKAEGGGGRSGGERSPAPKKRPTSPPEGDTPCKKQQLGSGLLPETAAPIFDISMFGASAAALHQQESTSRSHHEYTVDPSETESRASSKSPLEAVLDSLGLTKPLAININGPPSSSSHPLLPSCSGPSTALTTSSSMMTHDDSPSDSESDDVGRGAAASRALLASSSSTAAAAAAAAADDVMLPAGDSLSPFLQSVLAGTVRAADSDIFCTVPAASRCSPSPASSRLRWARFEGVWALPSHSTRVFSAGFCAVPSRKTAGRCYETPFRQSAWNSRWVDARASRSHCSRR